MSELEDNPPIEPKDQTPGFEQAIGKLESIIDEIESGDIGLEQSLAQYERGMKLIGSCRSLLAKAEHRIAQLTTDAQGLLQAADHAEGEPDNG